VHDRTDRLNLEHRTRIDAAELFSLPSPKKGALLARLRPTAEF
jgi:hypothetical protein